MWLCGIMACLVTKDEVKQRTASLNHKRSGLHHHHLHPISNPRPHHHPPTHRLTANCYFRGSPAGLVSKGNTTGSSLSWWVHRDESNPAPPTSFPVSPPSHPLCSSPAPPPFCFSVKGNLKLVRFVFLPLLAKCLLLKPRCWRTGSPLSEKHEGDCVGGGEEGWHGWILTCLSSLDVFIFQTGLSVCWSPDKQSTTNSSLLT